MLILRTFYSRRQLLKIIVQNLLLQKSSDLVILAIPTSFQAIRISLNARKVMGYGSFVKEPAIAQLPHLCCNQCESEYGVWCMFCERSAKKSWFSTLEMRISNWVSMLARWKMRYTVERSQPILRANQLMLRSWRSNSAFMIWPMNIIACVFRASN